MRDYPELKGKVGLVTGASRGIGEAIALELARQGVALGLVARNREKVEALAERIVASGGEVVAIGGDVSSFEDLWQAAKICQHNFGSVDILVNNAGLIDPIARLEDSDPEAWSKVIDVNVKGVYYGMKAVLPYMQEKGAGTIINLSSGAAQSFLEGWSHYCSSKAAVKSLTGCADKELRAAGIRVIGLSPGTVATDMMGQIKNSGVNPVSQLDWSVHIGPDWPARAVAYLCSIGGDAHCGTDFSIKTEEGRREAGLIE